MESGVPERNVQVRANFFEEKDKEIKYIGGKSNYYIFFLSGETLDSWTGIQANASNSFIDLSWTPPPNSFLGASSVEKYLILYRPISAQDCYRALWLPADKTLVRTSRLVSFTNYSFILVAITTDESQRGNTGWIRVQTDEGGKPD